MAAFDGIVDVAVIDEAQNLFDPSRGWAWTAAILGCPARDLIIICADHALRAVAAVLDACGETPLVTRFARKSGALVVLPRPVPLAELRPGDAVVTFARVDALVMADNVAAAGRTKAVVYGALPPEVRRREAERFATGDAQVLCATDAIGQVSAMKQLSGDAGVCGRRGGARVSPSPCAPMFV